MRIQDCYNEMGGNFDEVLGRLASPALVERFVVKFLNDSSYEDLCRQMDCGTREDAFKAAHTLKGVCANLSLTTLFNSVAALTDEVRHGDDTISARAQEMFAEVKRDYEMTTSVIRRYEAE